MRISRSRAIVAGSMVSNGIHLARETRVMLGADLAVLYGISTSNPQRSSEPKSRQVSAGFHVPPGGQRASSFDIPIWNIKPTITILSFLRRLNPEIS
jgi:hypothetical protein